MSKEGDSRLFSRPPHLKDTWGGVPFKDVVAKVVVQQSATHLRAFHKLPKTSFSTTKREEAIYQR